MALFLFPSGPSWAIRGDLSFPLEGWALVSHWHLAAGARSAREGWMMRLTDERPWRKLAAGKYLPASPRGSWLRNAFRFSTGRWEDACIKTADLPATGRPLRIFVNGRQVLGLKGEGNISLAPYLRSGINSVVLALPGHGAKEIRVPGLRVSRVRRGGGEDGSPVLLRNWRVRGEEIEEYVPKSWLAGGDTAGWAMRFPCPPTEEELWLPPSPVCLKAVLDFPHYWRRHSLSLFLHDIPGDPDVFVNGRKVADRMQTPARIELAGLLKKDGRDTLCLVYPGLPRRIGPGKEGGIAAIHWAPGVRLPPFPSGTTLFFERLGGGSQESQESVSRGLALASQLLAVSSTPYVLAWSERDAQGEAPRDTPGGILAAWPASPFSLTGLDSLGDAAAARLARLSAAGRNPLLVISPPAVGSRMASAENSRLILFRNRLEDIAPANGASPLRLFDVFRSALRCQGRWPARPLFAENDGRLTAHGSFLMGLAVIDAFSLL